MFGIDSGSDVNQLMKKWKDNENGEGEGNEEEMEDDVEYKIEKQKNKTRKQVNDDSMQTEAEEFQVNIITLQNCAEYCLILSQEAIDPVG